MIDSFPLTELIIFTTIVLVGLTVYKFIIKPKSILKRYSLEFTNNKWNLLNLNFTPFDTIIRPLT